MILELLMNDRDMFKQDQCSLDRTIDLDMQKNTAQFNQGEVSKVPS